jgi:phosphoribosylformylglycinamidine cyclo-ligase
MRYDKRGVSAQKEDVHKAIAHLDKGLHPNAFCKILPDITGADQNYCNIMHADTAGTKTSLAYLYWKETGDLSVWRGIAQDAIVMNIDDMACVGCVDDIVISSTIGRNKHLIPGEVISAIINGAEEFFEMLRNHDIRIHSSGGETADVGDIVRTIDVGYTTFARLHKDRLKVNNIKDGNVIIGLSSSGISTYESEYNGGTGSNGLTSARHDNLHKNYREYTESYAPETPLEYVYCGIYKLTDKIHLEGVGEMDFGKLLLSPTRTYLPVLKQVLNKCFNSIHGIIHCTGGAQTKVLKFVEGVSIIKDDPFEIPPIFDMIRTQSDTSWQEMYQVYNMGHRMELYVEPDVADKIIEICKSFNIESKVIGHVEQAESKELRIQSPDGWLHYK